MIVEASELIINIDGGHIKTTAKGARSIEAMAGVIYRRCKGQQHMRWSREGLGPLLKIIAALNSKGEWKSKWRTVILNAA